LLAGGCGYIDIPAVESQSGRGSTVRVTICVTPGSGGIVIYGVERVESDTLASIITSYILAQIYSGKSFSGLELSIYFGRSIEDVAGPSAGALLTYAFYNMLSRGSIDEKISGTGAINLDGSVEAVGGIPQKLSALRSIGYRSVFIPAVSYIQYSRAVETQFRDMEIEPLGGIGYLLNISPQRPGQVLISSHLLSRVSEIHAEILRNETQSLLNTYISRVSDRGSQGYRDAATLLDIASKTPPPEGYPSVNLYYLALTSIAQALVEGDPTWYRRILAERAVEGYNKSLGLLRSVFSDIPRRASLDQYIAYLILFERALDLAGYSSAVRAYTTSGDAGSIAPLAGQIYGRTLSIEYWSSVLKSAEPSQVEANLEDIYRASREMLGLLGISNLSDTIYARATDLLGRDTDLEGLSMLSSAYTIYSYLRNYSASLRAATISQIPAGGSSSSYVETILSRGYMAPAGPLASEILTSMYAFSTWALRVLGNTTAGAPQILTLSLISTSSSASALNILGLVYAGAASPPRHIELARSQQSQMGTPGAGGDQQYTYGLVSNLLAVASVLVAVTTALASIALKRVDTRQGRV